MDQTLPGPDRDLDETPTLPQKLKIYLVEVVLKRVSPAAFAAFIASAGAFYAAHKELLEKWGVTYGNWPIPGFDASGPVIIIELDTVNAALWALVSALATGVIIFGWHHTSAAVTGKPQSGGQRATDK